jgi:hypothetical protein
VLSKVLLIIFYGLLLRRYIQTSRGFETTLCFATAGCLTYFAVNTGVHENHLYIASVLGLLAGYFIKHLRFISGLIAGLNNVNLLLFYGLTGDGLGFSRVCGIDISLPFAILGVVLCGYYWWTVMGCGAAERGAAEAKPQSV